MAMRTIDIYFGDLTESKKKEINDIIGDSDPLDLIVTVYFDEEE